MENISNEYMDEIYPQVSGVSEATSQAIGDYTCSEKAVSLCKAEKNSNTITEREFWQPEVVSDARYANKLNKLLFFARMCTESGASLITAVIMCFVAVMLSVVGSDIVFDVDNRCKNLSLILFIIAGVLLFSTYIISALCRLKSYGLSNDTGIWIINFRDEAVLPAKLVGVKRAGKTVKDATFKCTVFGVEYNMDGDEIYFTQEAATEVLDYILSVNDNALAQYYPDWRNDSAFAAYYKKMLPTRGLEYSTNYAAVGTYTLLADNVIINGVTLNCCLSAKKLIKAYLKNVKERQKNDDEKQALINAVNKYKNSLQ